MALSVVAFVIGSPLHIKLKSGGSPLVRLAQVIVAAFKKRNAQLPKDSMILYENGELDASISSHGKLLHTDQLRTLGAKLDQNITTGLLVEFKLLT
ncbi:protein NRT1/ PTR FAMILY 3.1-like [Prunus yedoensis var. nudiflora]|uniref:Protein NRT1/ PTR FAMILY 3.1-like n=1 Tax=Prunus yedoensis var. nudiflora TaxID=2094558 RepID=A0A314XJP2_PRUYE|nr:protein NRT1/ PTR FAMILY 3.1-like [Prunus yedoensis var. nudiflora]